MKNLIMMLGLLLSCLNLTSTAIASDVEMGQDEDSSFIFLSYCSNFDQGVSSAYVSCVNSNFSEINRQMNYSVFLQNCYSYGDNSAFAFTSCVANNFSYLTFKLKKINLSYCSNFSNNSLDYSFINCVNSNFTTIGNVLPVDPNEALWPSH